MPWITREEFELSRLRAAIKLLTISLTDVISTEDADRIKAMIAPPHLYVREHERGHKREQERYVEQCINTIEDNLGLSICMVDAEQLYQWAKSDEPVPPEAIRDLARRLETAVQDIDTLRTILVAFLTKR